MKETQKWTLIACYAPIVFGAAYYVTKEFLPLDSPIWGAAIRALPAGILLLLFARELPTESWWWRSVVLGIFNFGYFFLAVYIAAVLLPSSTAATVMALGPMVMMFLAWPILRERPVLFGIIGAVLGFGGVVLLVSGSELAINPVGLLVSASALLSNSIGSILTKKWNERADSPPIIASTAWQLIGGGTLLAVIAALVEGAPPAIGAREAIGFVYISVFASALAYLAWFGALKRLPAGKVGLIGLLNPITGVVVGAMLASEAITLPQAGGIVLILSGVVLGQRGKARQVQKPKTMETSNI